MMRMTLDVDLCIVGMLAEQLSAWDQTCKGRVRVRVRVNHLKRGREVCTLPLQRPREEVCCIPSRIEWVGSDNGFEFRLTVSYLLTSIDCVAHGFSFISQYHIDNLTVHTHMIPVR